MSQIEISQPEALPKNYCVISYQKRIQLIEDVCVKKKQIIQVASSLGIKLSTAKYILRSFRKNGKVLKKVEELEQNMQELSEKLISLKVKIREINKIKSLKKKKAPFSKKISQLYEEKNLQELMIASKLEKTEENQTISLKSGFDFPTSLFPNAEEKLKNQQNIEQYNEIYAFCYCFNPLWRGLTPIEYYYV